MKKTETDEIDMMMNPNRWPLPVLPVKRYKVGGALPELSVILPNSPNVHMTDIFKMAIDEAPVKTYESYEATVMAGWVVD